MTYIVFKSNIFFFIINLEVLTVYLLLSFYVVLTASTMNIFNGQLSAHCVVYLATIIIHLIALITFTLIMFLKSKKFPLNIIYPLFYIITQRLIGCTNCNFLILSSNNIGAALLTALGLLGQMIISIILESKKRLARVIKRKLTPLKWLSLIIVTIGIGVMVK